MSENFGAAVKLLIEPKHITDEMYVCEGLATVDLLPVLQADQLIHNIFDALSK